MDINARFSTNGNGHASVMEGGRAEAGRGRARNGEGAGENTGRDGGRERAQNGENTERDVAGRFAAGNKGGPGNPYSRHVAQLKIWLAAVVGEAEIKSIGNKLVEKANAGEIPAARLLFQYLLPKNVEPDRMNMEEWNLFKEGANMFAEMPALLTRPGPELPINMVRVTQETQTNRFGDLLVNLLKTPQDKLGDVSELMVSDPAAAMKYLETGSGTVLGKGNARKGGTGRARNGEGKRAKR